MPSYFALHLTVCPQNDTLCSWERYQSVNGNSPVVSDLSSSQELCLRSPWKEIAKQSSKWSNELPIKEGIVSGIESLIAYIA